MGRPARDLLGHRADWDLTFRRGGVAIEPLPSPGFQAGRRLPQTPARSFTIAGARCFRSRRRGTRRPLRALPGQINSWVSRAFLQQSVVEVNEVGTIAAAAASGGHACSQSAPPATFHADHPFRFFIRDNHAGVILFLGRAANPAQF